MATRTIDHPTGPASGFGLGWAHSTLGESTMLSHGGGSNGGRALLAAVPDADFAYATFVSSSVSGAFQAELQRRIVGEVLPDHARVLGARPVTDTGGDPARVDLDPFVGTFRRKTSRVTIRRAGDGLTLESEWILAEAEGTAAYVIGQPTTFHVEPVNERTLRTVDSGGPGGAWTFLEPDLSGRYQLMYSGGRLSRRIS